MDPRGSDTSSLSASDFVEDGRIRIGALLGLFASALAYAWAEGISSIIVALYDGVATLVTTHAEGWISLLRTPFEFNIALWGESWSIAGAALAPLGVLAYPLSIVLIVAFVYVAERLIRSLTEAS